MAPSRALRPLRTICTSCARHQIPLRPFSSTPTLHNAQSHLPRIASPSFWAALIPKPLRRPSTPEEAAARAQHAANNPKSKQWNPFTPIILLAILVGSNSVHIINLRKEQLAFSRKTEAKLALLREVVQRVKDGEDVDVAAELGTGEEVAEAEWEEVVRELESTDMLAEGRRKRAEKKRAKEEMRARELEEARMREGGGGKKKVDVTDVEKPANDGRPKFLM